MRNMTAIFGLILVTVVSMAETQSPAVKKVELERIAPSDGPAMYRAYCASCHGTDGKGRGPAAAAMKTTPTDLTAISRKNGGKFPELKVMNSISGDNNQVTAHGSAEMPVWGTVLRHVSAGSPGEQQLRLRNLTKYIESIQAR